MDADLKQKLLSLVENFNKLTSEYLRHLENEKHPTVKQSQDEAVTQKLIENASDLLATHANNLKLKNEVKLIPYYKQSWFLKLLALFLTALSGLAGYIFTWNASRTDILYKELQSQRASAAKIITDDIEAQKLKVREIYDSFYKLKYANLVAAQQCGKGTKSVIAEMNNKRYDARFDYITKTNATFAIFNLKVSTAFLEYAKFDDGVPDICAASAPKESDWFKIQYDMNVEYRKFINEERRILIAIYEAQSSEEINNLFIKYLELRNQ